MIKLINIGAYYLALLCCFPVGAAAEDRKEAAKQATLDGYPDVGRRSVEGGGLLHYDPVTGKRNNPDAESNIALLLSEWRRHEGPLQTNP